MPLPPPAGSSNRDDLPAMHHHVKVDTTRDQDTDPEPFKRQEVTAKFCYTCSRGWDYFTVPELERWLGKHMSHVQARNVAAAFKRDNSD